jgi:hypothetical protein
LPEPKKRPMRSFTAIMTSPGKGPKVERAEANPIGFASEPYRAGPRTLSCVGFAESAGGLERIEPPASAASHASESDRGSGGADFSRVRESDCDAGFWCERTGEFVSTPLQRPRQPVAAEPVEP